MPICLNNIILHGKIRLKKEGAIKFDGTKDITFRGNKIHLTKTSLNLILTKNIQELFCQENIYEILRKIVRKEVSRKGKLHNVRVTNIQHSATLPLGRREVISELIPHLNKHFKIEHCEISQELNCPSSVNVQDIIRSEGNIQFMCIKFTFFGKRAHLKLQFNQTNTKTFLSLILTSWNDECKRLVQYLDTLSET